MMSNKDETETYIDINEIINYGYNLPSLTINDKTYEFVQSKVRKRIVLNVK